MTQLFSIMTNVREKSASRSSSSRAVKRKRHVITYRWYIYSSLNLPLFPRRGNLILSERSSSTAPTSQKRAGEKPREDLFREHGRTALFRCFRLKQKITKEIEMDAFSSLSLSSSLSRPSHKESIELLSPRMQMQLCQFHDPPGRQPSSSHHSVSKPWNSQILLSSSISDRYSAVSQRSKLYDREMKWEGPRMDNANSN